MRAFVAPILVAIAASIASAASPRITAEAVWNPPEGFLESMHRTCDGRSGKALADCFASAMKSAGAPAPALAFTRLTGNREYLRFFRDTGVVDVACATDPFRANENDVCYLVNGSPPMIDVDDPKYRDEAMLRRNLGYETLRKRYPNLAVFPGPRAPEPAIGLSPRPVGSPEFAVEYFLQDGCHACARIASMRLAFDFDDDGRFQGSRLFTIRVLKR